MVSGINVNALTALKKYLGMNNPVQVKDNQQIMSYGTPEQVKEETRRRIEDLATGGGFIFAPIHVIQNGFSPENIMAWWETLQEYNKGSINV